ncbi:RNA-binding protein [Oscillospiraceae bacterium HV4-5-C5C]|nr:RNA-binding protein [Oscillospiraceae bacterium HV4-5-C5C]
MKGTAGQNPAAADLIKQALSRGSASTHFLNPVEAEALRLAVAGQRQAVTLTFYGGFEGAERQLAVVTELRSAPCAAADVISAVAVRHRPQDELGHRDLLGAVLGLGLKREAIGDIVPGPVAYLICQSSLADFIAAELTQVGPFGVTAGVIPLGALPPRLEQLEEQTGTVASARLDAVLAAIFHLARGKASAYILSGKVQLACALCQKPDREVSSGQVISVRGLGRAKILTLGGQSRKGRLIIRYGRYI